MKDIFKNATEKIQFTVNIGGYWKKKKVFEFSPPEEDEYLPAAVSELGIFGKSMNVKSVTENGLMLYSFDILGNKITAKVKFEDVALGNTLDV